MKMALRFSLGILLSFIFISPQAEAKGLCVIDDFANLRSGPGLEFSKTLVVNKYTPLEAVSKQGRWYKVRDFENAEHWVREDLVTSAMKCAIVKADYAYVRRGPGLSWPKKTPGRADKYVSFRLLEKRGEWARVQDQEGDIVWIHQPLLWIR